VLQPTQPGRGALLRPASMPLGVASRLLLDKSHDFPLYWRPRWLPVRGFRRMTADGEGLTARRPRRSAEGRSPSRGEVSPGPDRCPVCEAPASLALPRPLPQVRPTISVILNPRRRASETNVPPGTASSRGTEPIGVWPCAINDATIERCHPVVRCIELKPVAGS